MGLTPHEKECALAAIAVRIEAAKREGNIEEAAEWIRYRREILSAPSSQGEEHKG